MANILGLITVNHIEILQVDADPGQGLGTEAPRGSIAIFDNGVLGRAFIKVGTLDVQWSEIQSSAAVSWSLFGNQLSGVNPNSPNEFLGSVNNYDVVFKRFSTELMRLTTDGLLIGLNASMGGRLQVKDALGNDLIKQISPATSGASVIHVTRQYKVNTTDNTPTLLASLAVPTSSRLFSKFYIGCNQFSGTGGSLDDGACYERSIVAKRLSSGNVILKKVQADFTVEDNLNFDVVVNSDANNVNVLVEGDVNCNIAWSAHCNFMIFSN